MTINFPPLEPWLKVLFKTYLQSKKSKWIVTKSRRQVGKSICLELLLLYVSLANKNAVSLFVSPVISLSRKVFKDLKKLCQGKIQADYNASILTIEFLATGSVIEFCSAEQGDAIRGKTVKNGGILCVDEASFMSSDFFYEVLTPTTNVHQADIFITSTPKFKQGFFYELFAQGLDKADLKVVSIDWNDYDTSKYLSQEQLDIYRQKLPRRVFTSEYLGQFIDGDSTVFNNYTNCTTDDAHLDKDKEVVIGIDWGTGSGNDYTVLTIGQTDEDNKKVKIYRQIAFNDKTTNLTIDCIMEVVKNLVGEGFKDIKIIVEKNSIGAVFFSLLFESVDKWETTYNDAVSWRDEIEINVNTFTTSNSSKKRIIEQLSAMFENNLILIPKEATLLNELAMYECKVDKNTGLVTYNAPNGFHDDRVMSLAFAADYLYNQINI